MFVHALSLQAMLQLPGKQTFQLVCVWYDLASTDLLRPSIISDPLSFYNIFERGDLVYPWEFVHSFYHEYLGGGRADLDV